ncbi:MAG TPA: alpha/beta hydrolase [Candidatus Saccharimonadales bacterium]|nr:alpha/beta hydrolase [Candidatus Saccharimonadales bacterium]
MPLVHANGLDIHYRISGEGVETVLLISGVGDDLEGWAMQIDPLVGAGLRVITFDNRGVGRSSRPPGPYTSREMASDTKALADALGLTDFHLVGVSLGGLIAQEYALAYPGDLRSVVLANTYAKPDAYTRAAFDVWGRIAEAGGMPLMMLQQAPWVFSPAFYDANPERLAGILQEMVRSPQPASSFSAQIAALLTHDSTDRLGSLEPPALVIAADDDIIIRLSITQRLFEELPRGSWVIVPGGHAAFLENPDPWNRAVIAFIDQHRGAVH